MTILNYSSKSNTGDSSKTLSITALSFTAHDIQVGSGASSVLKSVHH